MQVFGLGVEERYVGTFLPIRTAEAGQVEVSLEADGLYRVYELEEDQKGRVWDHNAYLERFGGHLVQLSQPEFNLRASHVWTQHVAALKGKAVEA